MLFDVDGAHSAVAAGNSLTHRCRYIPTAIAATKISTAGAPEASEVSAGPGQKPPNPQPAPKIAAPKISFASRSLRLGTEKSGANNGDCNSFAPAIGREVNRDRAEHDERQAGVPGPEKVQKADHLHRTRHPGDSQTEREYYSRNEGGH